MTTDVFAEWLQRQGLSIVKTPSSYWCRVRSRVYQAFPYSWVIEPSEEEIKDILRKKRAVALRYSTSLENRVGRISYHVISDDPSYSLESLPKKARYDVLHGLEYVSCEAISMRSLAQDGWELRRQTLVRQGRPHAETRKIWERMCLSAEGLTGFEAWGAIRNGELVAALLSCSSGDTVSILYQQSKTQHLRFGVNNALVYTFTREVFQRPGMRRIFYGLHSLDAPAGVDHFKFRMGYTAKPVRQRVVFNPFIRPLVNNLSLDLLKRSLNMLPTRAMMEKVVGVFQFYLQGNRPLFEQEWPKALLNQKDAILSKVAGPRCPTGMMVED